MSDAASFGSFTMRAILRRMKSAAASFACSSTPMSLNVANMKRNPPPIFQASSNTRSRSSADTLIAGTGLSGKPNAVTDCSTPSQ